MCYEQHLAQSNLSINISHNYKKPVGNKTGTVLGLKDLKCLCYLILTWKFKVKPKVVLLFTLCLNLKGIQRK